jgi:U3 small nucleolar RNA-associated protein 22
MILHGPKRRKLDHYGGQTVEEEMISLSDSDQELQQTISSEQKRLSKGLPSFSARASSFKDERESESFTTGSEESYKSSLFKLQVDEMLAEVQMHPLERMGTMHNLLQKLKSTIEGIDDKEALSVSRSTAAI